jgi:hypothetical protein
MLLGACGLLSVITLGINLITLISPQAFRSLATLGAPRMVLIIFGLYGLLAFGIGIATTVVFLVWLYYASSNLPAFGYAPTEIKYSPGWAIGSFFVPFVNLVVPFLAINELWQKSDVVEEPPAGSWQSGSILTTDRPESSGPPLFFPLWWLFWITSGFLANFAAINVFLRMSRPALAAIGLLAGILRLAAAGLAIMVVREIDRRQTQASEKIPKISAGYPLPPPPPVFHERIKRNADVEMAAHTSEPVIDQVADPEGISD